MLDGLGEYIDLADPEFDFDQIIIKKSRNGFGCELLDSKGRRYKGFLLAKTEGGKAYTLCDLDFHWSATDKKLPPRLTFRKTDKHLADKTVNRGKIFQRIPFHAGEDGYREFWNMIAFLIKYKDLVDLGEFLNKYQVVNDEGVVLRLKKETPERRKEIIAKYANGSEVNSLEMAEVFELQNRKDGLEIFHKLLFNVENFSEYYRTINNSEIKGGGEEAIWHHFLSNNKWIFGLSLDLRFIEDFVDEASIGNADTSNRGNAKTDILGWNDFTVLVELKTPGTPIFTTIKSSDARTNTWSFAPEFIEGFSQCLAQKEDWTKNSPNKKIVFKDDDGVRKELDKGVIRTIDPQVIYIVGNKEEEIPKNSNILAIITKRETLERFIKNNRNVNIISYDELYTRAYHIVHGQLPLELDH